MTPVEFLFDIDTRVETPLEQVGIIFACLLDNTRIKQYWVRTQTGEQCYREDQLTLAD